MNCEEVKRFLDTYLDGELDMNRGMRVEQHLSLCTYCQSLAQERQDFASFCATGAVAYKAPARLKARIVATMQREQARQRLVSSFRPWVYATGVVVSSLVLALSLFISLNILFPDREKELSRQAVLRHSHSLLADHLVDIASSNPRIVQPWLTAKLDFAPPVVSLPASGYALLGGRIEVIQNRPVATLVYKRDKDLVTLFCWPPHNEHLSKNDHFMDGYQVSTWSNAQCNYILVSKLSDGETADLVDSFRADTQSGRYF